MIKVHMQDLETTRGGHSFACLAERGEKTENNPHGFDVAKAIAADDVVVLTLTGTGDAGIDYSNYNGYLKRTNEYIAEIAEKTKQPVRSVVAIVDFGKYYSPKAARKLLAQQFSGTKEYDAQLQRLTMAERQEYIMPHYVEDIFNNVFLERISTNGRRISTIAAAQNIRKAIIFDHCHGGYVALKLEELMLTKMKKLGYNKSEREKIMKQLLVMSYAPDCPLGVSKAQTIAFSSAMDYETNHGSALKDYLQCYDFGIAYFPDKMGNVFYCAQIDKRGIEGNPPPVYTAVAPNEWFEGMYKDKSDDTNYLGEHEFPGFRKYDNMSNGALQMRTYMRQIFKNALLHSLKQKEEAFTPLPSIAKLASNDTKSSRQIFFRTKLAGYRLWADMQIQTKLLRRNFKQDIMKISLD